MAEDGSLKAYIQKQVTVADGQPVSADLADTTREWLAQKNILDVVVKAIQGEEINGETLRLKDRVNFALKLSNKLLPDLKSTEQKKTETLDVNVRHSATAELLEDAGVYGAPIVNGEIIEVEDEG